MSGKNIQRIVKGNDFSASVPLIKYTVSGGTIVETPFPINEATNIVVSIISESNVKTQLKYTIDSSSTSIVIQVPGSILTCGFYGLEIVGEYEDKPIRSYSERIFELVHSNEQAYYVDKDENSKYTLSDMQVIDAIMMVLGSYTDKQDVLTTVKDLLNTIYSEVKNKLSRVNNDAALGLISFAKGILLGENGKYYITAIGEAILSTLASSDFNSTNQTGFSILKKDNNGHYVLSITDLIVWGKAIFNILEIRKISYVGGNYTFSAAGSKLAYVLEEDSDYKCYILTDDGTTSTTNTWEVGDQALCQTFNVKEGVYNNVSNKRYWRLVQEISSDNEVITTPSGDILYNEQKFAWIKLSKTDCETGSDVPSAGDTIALWGSRKEGRQGIFTIITEGDNSPAAIWYSGVHTYSLENCSTAMISPQKVFFTAKFFQLISNSGSAIDLTNNFSIVTNTDSVAVSSDEEGAQGEIVSPNISVYALYGATKLGIGTTSGYIDTANSYLQSSDGKTYILLSDLLHGNPFINAGMNIAIDGEDKGADGFILTPSVYSKSSVSGNGYVILKLKLVALDGTVTTIEKDISVVVNKKGSTGDSNWSLYLDNQATLVSCDYDGNVIGDIEGTKATLYYGSTEVTGAKYEATFSNCTGNISSVGQVTMLTITSDSASVTIKATSGTIVRTAIFSLSKVKAGKPGDAVTTYKLQPSVNVIKKSANGTITPSTVTCKQYKQTNGTPPIETTDCVIKYNIDGGTETTGSSVDINTSYTYIEFILYSADGKTEWDRQRVPIIADGDDGYNYYLSPNTTTFKADSALSSTNPFIVYASVFKGSVRQKALILSNTSIVNCSITYGGETATTTGEDLGTPIKIIGITDYTLGGSFTVDVGVDSTHHAILKFTFNMITKSFVTTIVDDEMKNYATTTEVDALGNTISSLSTTVTQNSTKIDNLATRVTQNETNIGELKTQATEISLEVKSHKEFRNLIPFSLLNATHSVKRTIHLEKDQKYIATTSNNAPINYTKTVIKNNIPTGVAATLALNTVFTWTEDTKDILISIGNTSTDYTNNPILWAQIEKAASNSSTATGWTRKETDYSVAVNNLFEKPLATTATFVAAGNSGEKLDVENNVAFGVVQNVTGTSGNLCLQLVPKTITVDEEVTLFVIAKSTGGTSFQFGWYDSKDTINKYNALNTTNAKTIELGDDWYIYYIDIVSSSDMNTAASETFWGLNTVVGSWQFASFGLVYGGVPPYEPIIGDLGAANDRASGIYTFDRMIVVRTDNFFIQDSSGNQIAVFYKGSDGKPYLDAGFIKAQSVSAWILMQPFQDFSNISEFQKGQSFSWRIKGLTAEADFGFFSTSKTGVIINIWNTSSYNAKFHCSVINRGTSTKFGAYTVYVPPYCLMHAVSVPTGTTDSDTGLENIAWNLLCPHTISQAIIYITGFN